MLINVISSRGPTNLHIVTCTSDFRRGFGLEIAFIDHLRIVTTSNYNSLTELHSKYHCNYSTYKVFSLFTSRFLVTDFNTVRLRPHRLARIPQLN
jgi:hypothetical protein